MKRYVFLLVLVGAIATATAQQPREEFTHADTLRGSLNPNRDWWDVTQYNISVTPDYTKKTIQGTTVIAFKTVKQDHPDIMQIDLQEPLVIDKVLWDGQPLQLGPLINDHNVWLIQVPETDLNSNHTLTIRYHGKPIEAKKAPWDGGWIWTKDQQDRPWMSVAVQELGASAWYPCKDHQSDEPDSGALLAITVADTLMAVGNGRNIHTTRNATTHTVTYSWQVKDPINNYCIIPYIGKYVSIADTFTGLNGKLDLTYWVLDYNVAKAREHFSQVKLMLRAFEYWFGPYPFYTDGYQLIDAPHLGMEHQSAIAYGNGYQNGYSGTDLSGSGWGKKWDFIIVHESGHEWFANSITTKDIADMWVHESFTCYSETLFTEYYYGIAAGNAYNYGIRKKIKNDIPVIGPYGVNKNGSIDMYYKGANMLHSIRHAMNNDEQFRGILLGLNKTFRHSTVTSQQVESYISQQADFAFDKVFDQYLRTTQIPTLEYHIKNNTLSFRYTDCVAGFNMPLWLSFEKEQVKLLPTDQWKSITLTKQQAHMLDMKAVEKLFYINIKKGSGE